ncbi:MAG: 16S rRNA (cytidine(1402)-2'-O)-methyltransferase [Candidatus Cloacimonas sp.]
MPLGNIYLIPVPIGNLGDITLRALELLKKAELIACEDTRVTTFLLKQYEIPIPKLISFHKFNEKQREAYLLQYLESGKDLMIVSDAGSPAISDPAEKIVQVAIDKGIKVFALPGASALLPAISVSGFSTKQFQFVGFLAQQAKKRREKLQEIAQYPYPTIIYEAPQRLLSLLTELLQHCGNRKICICREISKLYEEHIYSTLEEIIRNPDFTLKGEFCLVLEGRNLEQNKPFPIDEAKIEEYTLQFLRAGLKTKEISKAIALSFSLEPKQAYQFVLKAKKKLKK